MLNEIEEFVAYTGKIKYKADNKYDSSYLGRFTYEMLMDFSGLYRVFVIIARGYLFRDDTVDIDRARKALCAWCSIPKEKTPIRRRMGKVKQITDRCIQNSPNWLTKAEKAGFMHTFIT